MRFALNFNINLKKEKILERFRKVSTTQKDINYSQFISLLGKIFDENQ